MEAVAEQVKELTLEFQLTNELRLNHELKEVEVGAEKQIKNFLLGELNLTGNKVAHCPRGFLSQSAENLLYVLV